MKKILVSLVSLILPFSVFGSETIDIDTTKALDVDAQAIAAIKKWNPEFQTYVLNDYAKGVRELYKLRHKERPMGVRADFNGDGRTDFAFMGYDKKSTYFIFAVNEKSGWKIEVIEKEDRLDPKKEAIASGRETQPGLGDYLALAGAGEIGEAPINKDAGALLIESYGGQSEIYQLQGSKVRSILE